MLIKNCLILGKEEKDILVKQGKIIKIGNDIKIDDKETINAKNLTAIPGSIDPHVHFRDLEQSHKEDFFTGSCAAVAGGVTTVLDMPNNSPPILSCELLEKKRAIASKAIVNYGFYFGTDGNNIPEIK